MPSEKWWQRCSQMHRIDSEQSIAYCVTGRPCLRCVLSVLQLYDNREHVRRYKIWRVVTC